MDAGEQGKAEAKFANINPADRRGPRMKPALAVGKHPLQLYSLATPNGRPKVTIMLEELLALGTRARI